MIKTFEHRVRNDGVKLVRRLDVQVDENGNPLFEEETVVDENGNEAKVMRPIPTGFKIRKAGTNEFYDEAIDVENTPFKYEETTIPIEKSEETIEEEMEEIQ